MDQREELIAELEKMLARLKALNPEQMAALNKYLSESREAAFLGEIINRVLDGSMAHEEAERWIKASDQDADEGKVS
jgi:hypothetical protein